MVIKATETIANRADGILVVSFGSKYMINMVNPTRAIIVYKGAPSIQLLLPSVVVLNRPSWEIKITMARPLTNPIITG